LIRSLLPILLIFIASLGYSQGNKDSLALFEDRDIPIQIRSFEGDLDQKYKGNDFNYDIRDGESQNLLARFFTWLMDRLNKVFGIDLPPGTARILEITIYVLMGCLAIYLLIRFLTGERASAIFSKKATSFITPNLSEVHIDHIDLDTLLGDAVAQKNYRSAIRYQYLIVLRTLSGKQIITWQYEKTNQDYEREISVPRIKGLFKEVSYLYDHIWYGEQDIDEPKYRAAQEKFSQLINTDTYG